jgi:L-threonylcarbamoyladenylate synthase
MKIDISTAVRELKKGNVVAIPTETVYGLGALITNIDAIKKIYEIKKRPLNNPLICHVHHPSVIERYAYIEDYQRKMFELWPGPLTILFKKKDIVPDIVTAGSQYCAFRIPDHPVFLEILKQVDEPIAAPSANPFAKISPVTAEMVLDYFENTIPVVDGGRCKVGLESTVIQFIDHQSLQVLRPGKYTKEFFEKMGYRIVDYKNQNLDRLLSPGLLPKHYSPSIPLILLNKKYLQILKESDVDLFINKLLNQLSLNINKNAKIGFLVYGDFPTKNKVFYNLSKNANLEEIAQNLFSFLKEMEQKFDAIISFKVEDQGIGIAINDRLKRAAEFKIEE